jgi:hypothetical protein
MVMFCIAPFCSSIANNLGPYDGLSTALDQTATWGMPYFLGRLYLNNLSAIREMAIGIFFGALSYIPFCLWETRFSPQLHRIIYGFQPHLDFAQSIRLGGYRPSVFMYHGLMVAGWMMAGTLIAFWLWRTGSFPKIFRFTFFGKSFLVKTTWLLISLFLTFILLRSTGAYFLLGLGALILSMGYRFRSFFTLALTVLLLCTYLFLGAGGYIKAPQRTAITSFVTRFVGAERAQSFEFRLYNEEILGDKARQSLAFGWGGWGRNRIYDSYGKDISATDSLWIIIFGTQGLFGLACFTTIMVLPILIFCFRYRAYTWGLSEIAPIAALAISFTMFSIDCLLNAMFNPTFVLMAGALNSVIFHPKLLRKVAVQNKSFRRELKPRNFL